jgi:hypothetical protein
MNGLNKMWIYKTLKGVGYASGALILGKVINFTF